MTTTSKKHPVTMVEQANHNQRALVAHARTVKLQRGKKAGICVLS